MSIDATTFDLAEYFAGTNYPTDEFPVYLNAAILQKRAKLSAAAIEAAADKDDEKAKAILEELETVNAAAEKSKFVIHIQGIDPEVERAIVAKVEETYPIKTDFLGRQISDPEANEALTTLLWQAKITRIVSPDGGQIVSPTEEEIKLFRAKAPKPAQQEIQTKLKALDEETSAGFNALVEDSGFLSMP